MLNINTVEGVSGELDEEISIETVRSLLAMSAAAVDFGDFDEVSDKDRIEDIYNLRCLIKKSVDLADKLAVGPAEAKTALPNGANHKHGFLTAIAFVCRYCPELGPVDRCEKLWETVRRSF